MNDAPERIWAQDADPDECNFIGGGWWDDQCGNTQHPHMVEYIRADLVPQWQPIETAPKDGTISMWSSKFGMSIEGKWKHYMQYNQPEFTHWMPIRTPPKV